MVTTARNFLDPAYNVDPESAYNGVVQVGNGISSGTGSLLYDGRAVLTAAHIFQSTPNQSNVVATFDTGNGTTQVGSQQVFIHPDYDPVNSNHDVAMIFLESPAPPEARRYDIYRDTDEIGQESTIVGNGAPGTGETGSLSNFLERIKLQAQNTFDSTADELKDSLGPFMGWDPAPDSILVQDFDSGSPSNDALGLFLNDINTGLGDREGLIAPGDSGGPAFIEEKVAGVASYISTISTSFANPDVDGFLNSSFGEQGFWARTSSYKQWVDETIRSTYFNVPQSPSEVEKSVSEGDFQPSFAYFLLQFTGERDTPDQVVSVDYQTRDGSAITGLDYVPISGRIDLYPNEDGTVIPVQIIPDNLVEQDETFYLDVTNPIGGSFGEGVSVLSASRTIVNDDLFFA